jgi:hypothetical protein
VIKAVTLGFRSNEKNLLAHYFKESRDEKVFPRYHPNRFLKVKTRSAIRSVDEAPELTRISVRELKGDFQIQFYTRLAPFPGSLK